MSKLFDIDSPIMTFLSKLANMMILSLLWTIFCIPIVTIGAATTAMYTVQIRLLQNKDNAIISHFWKAFCREFGKSTVLWIICVFILALVTVDLLVVFLWVPEMPGLEKFAMGFIAVIALMFTGYIFPLNAQFENSIPHIIKNAFALTLFFLPQSILAFVISITPMVLVYVFQLDIIRGLLIWAVFAAAMIENLRMRVFKGVFSRIISLERNDNNAME